MENFRQTEDDGDELQIVRGARQPPQNPPEERRRLDLLNQTPTEQNSHQKAEPNLEAQAPERRSLKFF